MNSHRRAQFPICVRHSACGAAFARVILDDHGRLPWRFFGRLTAAVQAGLSPR